MDKQPDSYFLTPPVDYEIQPPAQPTYFTLTDYVFAVLIVGVVMLGCYFLRNWQ
jgi:hypothetical protein